MDRTVPTENHEPAYLALHRDGRLAARAQTARAGLASCRLCPRHCAVDRLENRVGICRVGRHAVVASAFPHGGEEDCLRGTRGSGTVFFAGCNLRCVFCQNYDISQVPAGRVMDAAGVAQQMLHLQSVGCHNINWVTPEHVVAQVIESLAVAAAEGLRLPIVYNTSAYDDLASLALLDGLVDVYMPDFKFWEPATAYRCAQATDYPEHARAALLEMHRQVGPLRLDGDGLARRGVLVRHLVMPGQTSETEAILTWLSDALSPDTYVHLMGQYRPAHRVGEVRAKGSRRHADIDRRPTNREMKAAFAAARRAGLVRVGGRA